VVLVLPEPKPRGRPALQPVPVQPVLVPLQVSAQRQLLVSQRVWQQLR
jgi:hypothetical protein